jgi:hypothetical protein
VVAHDRPLSGTTALSVPECGESIKVAEGPPASAVVNVAISSVDLVRYLDIRLGVCGPSAGPCGDSGITRMLPSNSDQTEYVRCS